MKLNRIIINNFKSFEHVDVQLSDFNVIIGKNGSGKTNFIEAFKFIKNILIYEKRPYVPFIEWWNYKNIVWNNEIDNPINIKLFFSHFDIELSYEVEFLYIAGNIRISYEKMDINNNIVILREANSLLIKHNQEYLKKNSPLINDYLNRSKRFVTLDSFMEDENKDKNSNKKNDKNLWMNLSEQSVKLPDDFTNLVNHFITKMYRPIRRTNAWAEIDRYIVSGFRDSEFLLVCPSNEMKEDRIDRGIFYELKKAITDITILKHPSIKEIKTPSPPRRESVLIEDATNLNSILYYWYLENSGKLPERIEYAINRIFTNIQIKMTLSDEGNAYVKMYEVKEGKTIELDPPSIPDGLFKLLSILTAIETSPTLLAIDEIENSLYAETLQYIIDELKHSDTTVIMTTHSPLVVDIIKLEDLMIAEKTKNGTNFTKIKDPDELRDKLRELKITQSESWLYGDIFNE